MFAIKSSKCSSYYFSCPNLVIYEQVVSAAKEFLGITSKPPTVIQVHDFLV